MTYFDHVKAAILALKERSGSSNVAIKSWITKNVPGLKFQQHSLKAALKKGVESGKLIKIKNSYKLAESEKKPPKKPKAKKPKTTPKKKVIMLS